MRGVSWGQEPSAFLPRSALSYVLRPTLAAPAAGFFSRVSVVFCGDEVLCFGGAGLDAERAITASPSAATVRSAFTGRGWGYVPPITGSNA